MNIKTEKPKSCGKNQKTNLKKSQNHKTQNPNAPLIKKNLFDLSQALVI